MFTKSRGFVYIHIIGKDFVNIETTSRFYLLNFRRNSRWEKQEIFHLLNLGKIQNDRIRLEKNFETAEK